MLTSALWQPHNSCCQIHASVL